MAGILLVNPRRRRRRKVNASRRKHRKTRKVARRRKAVTIRVNPRRRRRVHHRRRHVARRRNPSLRSVGGRVVPTIKAGVLGAAGALGLDLLLGYLKAKLPAQLQTGYGYTATKILGAVGVGFLGNYVARGKGAQLAVGAMTVVLHDELKALLAAQFPTLALGEYMSYAPAIGYQGQAGVGEYMQVPTMAGFGEYGGDGANGSYGY